MRKKHGFTLIELLVVMLIIGIVTGIAVALFNRLSVPRRAKMQAEQIQAWLKALENRALVTGEVYSLKWQAHHVWVYRYLPQALAKGRWQQDNTVLNMPTFNSQITMQVDSHNKRIIFWPNGTNTPFTLKLNANNKNYINLSISENGVIT